VDSISAPTCPDCNGNGKCNSLGQCHCNPGFAPPTCSSPGNGGSIHTNGAGGTTWVDGQVTPQPETPSPGRTPSPSTTPSPGRTSAPDSTPTPERTRPPIRNETGAPSPHPEDWSYEDEDDDSNEDSDEDDDDRYDNDLKKTKSLVNRLKSLKDSVNKVFGRFQKNVKDKAKSIRNWFGA